MQNGEKLHGTFKILDKETIYIDDETIKLKDIEKLKRHPLLISLLASASFVYLGTVFIVISVIGAGLGQNSSLLWFTIPGAGAIYAAFNKSLNILKGYKKDKNWHYSIIEIPQ